MKEAEHILSLCHGVMDSSYLNLGICFWSCLLMLFAWSIGEHLQGAVDLTCDSVVFQKQCSTDTCSSSSSHWPLNQAVLTRSGVSAYLLSGQSELITCQKLLLFTDQFFGLGSVVVVFAVGLLCVCVCFLFSILKEHINFLFFLKCGQQEGEVGGTVIQLLCQRTWQIHHCTLAWPREEGTEFFFPFLHFHPTSFTCDEAFHDEAYQLSIGTMYY